MIGVTPTAATASPNASVITSGSISLPRGDVNTRPSDFRLSNLAEKEQAPSPRPSRRGGPQHGRHLGIDNPARDADRNLWCAYDLPYSVELWDDDDRHVEELIALTGDYRVARAAFDEAIKQRPGRIITLRQKTRLLADSRRKTKGSLSCSSGVDITLKGAGGRRPMLISGADVQEARL